MNKSNGKNIPREALEYYRFQAIILKRKKWKIDKIAEAFGVHRCTIAHWVTKEKRYGKESLKRTKAKGKEPKLNKEDKKQIISWLRKSAMEFGFETPLWDCKRIQKVIKKELNKDIAISNLWENLRRWELTPQKPEKEALEKNTREVKRWLKEEQKKRSI